jgi:membrane-bound inhibitor of C-type lysozyme
MVSDAITCSACGNIPRMNIWHFLTLASTTFSIAACSLSAAGQADALPMLPQTPGQTTVYNCQSNAGEIAFTTRTGPGELAVWLPPRFERPYLVLEQVRAASGAKYEGDGVLVWIKGTASMLTVDGEDIRDCREDRYASIWEHAKLSGVDFRGVGNEPGWVLEIRDAESIRFLYDYGQGELDESIPEPEVDRANRRTRYVTESFEVTLEGVICQDTMADHSYETRVTVILGDREFHGCGRALH